MTIIAHPKPGRHLRLVSADIETHPLWCWTKVMCGEQHTAEPVEIPATGGRHILGVEGYALFPVADVYASLNHGVPGVTLTVASPLDSTCAGIVVAPADTAAFAAALARPSGEVFRGVGGAAKVTVTARPSGVLVAVVDTSGSTAVVFRHDEASRLGEALTGQAATVTADVRWVPTAA